MKQTIQKPSEQKPSEMYLRYVFEYPNSSIARDYISGWASAGGHFATALFENRLNDAWIHADFNNELRMLYLGFRNNMHQSFKDCAGLECKLDDTRFVNDLVRLIIHLDQDEDYPISQVG